MAVSCLPLTVTGWDFALLTASVRYSKRDAKGSSKLISM